jgi:hypothetical protein
VDQSLTAKRVTVDSNSMLERAHKLKESVVKIQSLLSISDDDLHEFGNISQNLAIRDETSPKPPRLI